MALSNKMKSLCTPAMLYFVLSIIGLVISIIQNFGNKNIYKLGIFSTQVSSTILVFIVKIIYILFWTWVLNLICKDGHSGIAWFLVLVPFILLFFIMAIVVVNPHAIETIKHHAKRLSHKK